MKNYEKNKESSYLKYWEVNNLYGCKYHKSCLWMVLSGLKI